MNEANGVDDKLVKGRQDRMPKHYIFLIYSQGVLTLCQRAIKLQHI